MKPPHTLGRIRKIKLSRRLLRSASHFTNKGDWERSGNKIQLLLDMDVKLPNSKLIPMKILVDTGAQVNLVKRGLIPFTF